jgi:two-component system response regulator HydG
LAAHFLKEMNQRHGKQVSSIAEPVRRAMAGHDWPGNVRELRNIIESMVVQDRDGILNLDDLQEGDSLKRLPQGRGETGLGNLVGRPLNEVERYFVEKTLEQTGGNREEAARLLGIGERTLYRIIQDWKLQDKIRAALTEAGGKMDDAARLLGVKEQVLQRKIKKWGLETGVRNQESGVRPASDS